MNGRGSPSNIPAIIDRDFKQLAQQKRITYVRTFFSAYYSNRYAKTAQKYGIKLYLGVYMFDNPVWFKEQMDAAIQSVKECPNTVKAIIIGSENLDMMGGPVSVERLVGLIQDMKNRLRNEAPGCNVRVGTSQRINEWVVANNGQKSRIDQLARVCDFIGVNVYPFFSNGWNPNRPTDLLDKMWNQVLQRYPMYHNKLHITESGWPTSGGSAPGLGQNVATTQNALAYWRGFRSWTEKQSKATIVKPKFWFQAYDRRSDDPILNSGTAYEQHFGILTADGNSKY